MSEQDWVCRDQTSGHEEIIYADSAEQAARDYAVGGEWGERTATEWVDVWVRPAALDEAAEEAEEVAEEADEAAQAAQVLAELARAAAARYTAEEAATSRIALAARAAEEAAEAALGAADEAARVAGDVAATARAEAQAAEEHHTVALDPEEPDCEGEGGEHDWVEVSTQCHGGGVVVEERCSRCRWTRTTDSWAQRPDTGEQGLHSVSYEEEDCDD